MKTKTITLLVCGIVLFLFVSYVMIFIIIRPVDGMVTEDRPFVKKLCEMQAKCNGEGKLLHQCYSVRRHEYIQNDKLVRWSGYMGCNESTHGFYERGDGYKGVYVKSCSCETLD